MSEEPLMVYKRTGDHTAEVVKINTDGSSSYCIYLGGLSYLVVDHIQGHNSSLWKNVSLSSLEQDREETPGYKVHEFIKKYEPEVKKAFSDRGWENTALRTCKNGLDLNGLLESISFVETLCTVAKGDTPNYSTISDIFTAADSIMGNAADLKYPQDVPQEQIVDLLLSEMGFNRK